MCNIWIVDFYLAAASIKSNLQQCVYILVSVATAGIKPATLELLLSWCYRVSYTRWIDVICLLSLAVQSQSFIQSRTWTSNLWPLTSGWGGGRQGCYGNIPGKQGVRWQGPQPVRGHVQASQLIQPSKASLCDVVYQVMIQVQSVETGHVLDRLPWNPGEDILGL